LDGWDGIDGAAIEISYITGENSGRFQVAEVMERVFPEYMHSPTGFWKGLI
jgi:hypothetical protein